MVLSAYLEVSVSYFIKNTVRLVNTDTEIVLATAGVLNKFKVDKLFESGVLTVIGEVQTGKKAEEQVALIYKGEAIIKASKKDFLKASYELLKKLPQEKKFIDACEELWKNKSYKLIEILDHSKRPIGEFDEIFHNRRLFVEDKSAEELLKNINPKTGKPWWTFEGWAEKHIYKKTFNRIKALEIAKSTRARLPDGLSPDIEQIRNIRELQFHVLETNIGVKKAVNYELNRLKIDFPNWKFSVKFGE